jgi:hypothetical protein
MTHSTPIFVEVFHSGKGDKVKAPFLLVLERYDRQPEHPYGSGRSWTYWKRVPLNSFAVDPPRVMVSLSRDRYHIQ